MTDVAEAAGVSQTTVSLVLNGAAKARLAATTRDRVMQAAETLGYRLVQRAPVVANPAEAPVIGFVANEMAPDPWCAMALDGVRAKAAEHGVLVLTAVTGGDPETEQAVLARLAAMPLLGIVYSRIHTTRIDPPDALRQMRAVLLNCYTADRALPSVVPGEVAGGHVATDRLLRAGHRRIGFINGEIWMDASRDRLKGYRQSLATADLPFDPHLVRAGNWQPTSGYDCTMDLMRTEAPTAIFCANDLMALGCMAALRDLGLKVPEQVSVIGFDDREIAQHMRPPLTTVQLPHVEMGMKAAELLLQPPAKVWHIKVECQLVERLTVANRLPQPQAAQAEPVPLRATVQAPRVARGRPKAPA
jgi:LacI family transcriptional regulator